MWKLLIIGEVLFSCHSLVAQDKSDLESKWNRIGATLINRGNFYEALKIYQRLDSIASRKPDYLFALGVCTFHTFDKPSSLQFFVEAKALGYVSEILDYYLGRAYYFNNDIDKALYYLTLYSQSLEQSKRTYEFERRELQQLIIQISSARSVLQQHLSLDIVNMGTTVNSPYADYVPVVIADDNQLVFTSRRHISTGGRITKNGLHYEDIYLSKKDSSGQWATPIHFPGFNSSRHDANVALSHDGEKLFIYKANNNGDVFYSKKEGDEKWTRLKPLHGINTKYWEGSVCLSNDEQTIFFSSDRPGGYGGSDLYTATLSVEGHWINVTNMGPSINTSSDEDSPFIYKDGKTFFFSSEGHNSIGGHDIFSSRLTSNGEWDAVKNMGFPINTFDDDIFFYLNSTGSIGYFTSFRHSNFLEKSVGEKDLFQISRPKASPMHFVLKGKIIDDESKEPITAVVTLYDSVNNQQKQVVDIATGKFKYDLQFERKYRLTVEVAGKIYNSSDLYFPYQADLFEYFLPLTLNDLPVFDLKLTELSFDESQKSQPIILDKKQRAIVLVRKITDHEPDLKKLLESDKIPFSFREKLSKQIDKNSFLDQPEEGVVSETSFFEAKETTYEESPKMLELPQAQKNVFINAAVAKQEYEFSLIKQSDDSREKDKVFYNRLSEVEKGFIDRLANQVVFQDTTYRIATFDLLYYENLTEKEQWRLKALVISRTEEIRSCNEWERGQRLHLLQELLESTKTRALTKSKLVSYDKEAWEVLHTIETTGFEHYDQLTFGATLIKRNNGSFVGDRELIVIDDAGQVFHQLRTKENGNVVITNLTPGKRYHILVDDYTIALTGISRFNLWNISLTSQTDDFLTFYKNLDQEQKRRVDRISAAMALTNAYNESPVKEWDDLLALQRSSNSEKEVIAILGNYLRAESKGDSSFHVNREYADRYERMDFLEREKIDRMISTYAVVHVNGNCILSAGDSAFYKQISEQEKVFIKKISEKRVNEKHILGELLQKQSDSEYWYELGDINTHAKGSAKVKISGRVVTKNQPSSALTGGFSLGLMNETGRVQNVIHTDSSGKFSFHSIDANRLFKLLISKPNSGGVLDYELTDLTIEEDNPAFYDSLSGSHRRRIDRIVARNIADIAYAQNPLLGAQDDERYGKLMSTEKQFIDRLQRFLFAEQINEQNTFLDKEDHRKYYNILSENERSFVNRYVVRSFKDTLHIENVILEDNDIVVYNNLSSLQKQQISILQKHRQLTHDIFAENPTLLVSQRRVLLDSITPLRAFSNYAVRGQLVASHSQEEISNSQIFLTNRSGNVLAMVSTDAMGFFEFEGMSQNEELFAMVENSTTQFLAEYSLMIKNFRIDDSSEAVQQDSSQLRENHPFVEIYFDFNSAKLTFESSKKLNDWFEKNKKHLPTANLLIAGHTDSVGTLHYNQRLSEARCSAVAQFFTKQKLRRSQLIISAYGETHLKYVQADLNRRVELYIEHEEELK